MFELNKYYVNKCGTKMRLVFIYHNMFYFVSDKPKDIPQPYCIAGYPYLCTNANLKIVGPWVEKKYYNIYVRKKMQDKADDVKSGGVSFPTKEAAERAVEEYTNFYNEYKHLGVFEYESNDQKFELFRMQKDSF